MAVKLVPDQIRQRHHQEHSDIPHHTIDPVQSRPRQPDRTVPLARYKTDESRNVPDPNIPDDLTIRSRRFSSPRLSYGRLKHSAPLTQDLDDVAEIVLRRGPVERHPSTGTLLERFGEGGHGLLKVLCPARPLAQSHKSDAEIVLRRGPVEGRPRTGALLERLGEGGHGLIRVLCLAFPSAQGLPAASYSAPSPRRGLGHCRTPERRADLGPKMVG